MTTTDAWTETWNAAEGSTPHRRPVHRLALVLGSGGVRSAAALGIADVLARAGIRPDLLVGCSSGAVFAATLAQGLSSDEALRSATTLWSPELTEQKRWRAYAQLLAPRLTGFDAGFALRSNHLIVQALERAFGNLRLQDLPTPLRVSATEAASGAPVVLREGRISDALLASMALPFIFPSVALGGRRLVDGVVSDPLPVAAAGDAEVVLALGLRGVMPRRIDRASRLAAQATTTLINNLMQARLDAARAAGRTVIGIDLQLDRHVGLWQTSALPYLVEAGRRAATRQLPEIQAALERSAQRRAA